MTTHHIVSDGWSMEVLSRDVFSIYQGFVKGIESDLPSLPIQYKDYSAWQQSQLNSVGFEEHKKYWLDSLSGDLPLLDLPATQLRPKMKTHRGAAKRFKIRENWIFASFHLPMRRSATPA